MKRLVPAAIAALLACAPAEAQTFFSGLPNAPSVAAADWTLLRKASPSPGPGVGTVYQATIAQIFSPLKATGDCSGTVSAITLVLSCPGVANALPLAGGAMTGPITGASGLLPLAGGTMTGALMLSADPASSFQAATKSYVDTGIATVLPLAGGTLTGALILSGDPSVPLQAATKAYVDSGVGTGLPLAGGTMTGPILGASGLLPLAGGTLTGALVAPTITASTSYGVSASGNKYFFDGGKTIFLNWDGSRIASNAGLAAIGLYGGKGNNFAWSGAFDGFHTPVYSSGTFSGTSSGTLVPYNYFVVSSDTLDASANYNGIVSGLEVNHNFGGGATKGARAAGNFVLSLTAPTNAANANQQYVALSSTVFAQTGDNGTNTGVGSKGAFIALNAVATSLSGATNLFSVVGAELDVAIGDGSTSSNKLGMEVVSGSNDTGHGAVEDAGYKLSSATDVTVGSVAGFNMGVQLGGNSQQWPITTGGTVFGVFPQTVNGVSGLPFRPRLAANGVDLGLATFSGAALRSAGYAVDGTGNVSIGNALLGVNATGLKIDVPNQIVTAVAVSNGGTSGSYAPGDILQGPSALASQYKVLTTSVQGAAVVAGGTGGTSGTQTVTGTTGTGTKFQASVTIAGGAITAVGSITTPGSYTANPTSVLVEPVTGAGLTGATLAIRMGVATLSILSPDVAVAGATTYPNPVATVGGSGVGAALTLTWAPRNALQLNPSGDTISGTGAALGTTATSGFFHLPFTNGTPTGTPANTSVPCEWNDTSKTMNCYSPGASGWYHFTFTAGAA